MMFGNCLQDGHIEAEVKLTGILSLGALKADENRRQGTVIAPGLYAPVHQHFFVARLDMAVDCNPGEGLNQVCSQLFQILKVHIPASLGKVAGIIFHRKSQIYYWKYV